MKYTLKKAGNEYTLTNTEAETELNFILGPDGVGDFKRAAEQQITKAMLLDGASPQQVTHWMPLPAAPAIAEGKQA